VGHLGLSESVLTTQDIAPANLSSNTNGSVIDMSGWSGIRYEFNLGVFVAGVTFDARVMSSANANFSGPTNITNAALTQVANTSNANLAMLDVYRPTDRYVKVCTVPGAGVFCSVTATRYRRTGLLPPTQTAQQVVEVVSN
jgi:hypothetical protein